jgi:hypothetical protein
MVNQGQFSLGLPCAQFSETFPDKITGSNFTGDLIEKTNAMKSSKRRLCVTKIPAKK